MPPQKDNTRLKKDLGLFDVYAISTGAMFSSGFFLLPGLAAAKTGPSVVLAYFFAGILILPAMFSKAELSTALPRAGGTYFFLDRSLGPMFGTIGGLGTYLALTLKTAFALIGIGAYASLIVELPIKPVAVALTVAFVVINIVGAKESSGLQRVLVVVLMSVLAFFLVDGFITLATDPPLENPQGQFEPFMPFGVSGLLSTIGFVFVSYAGLTKVASVAEEVQNPERNIPLGMMLSLASTTLVYVAGVFLMVAVLEADAFRGDLTPVATAATEFFGWLPGQAGIILIVIAALAAFASTGNAGVLSASRYPLAMARDRLLPARLARLGKYRTPTAATIVTGVLMIAFILLLDEEGIAKLASAFQLFIFALVCLAVVVMRESRIPSYDPGYRSPLYPWMQVAGVLFSLILIIYMGWLAILFTLAVVVICLVWYYRYARAQVSRGGAIFHWFQRLGRSPYQGLDREFREILKEKGLRSHDPFEEVIARAQFLEAGDTQSFDSIVRMASNLLSARLGVEAAKIESGFLTGTRTGATPVARGAALPHLHVQGIDAPELVVARSRAGLEMDVVDGFGDAHEPDERVHAVFLLVSPEQDPGQHLRMLAEIATRIDQESFIERWLEAKGGPQVKELLLRDAHYLTLDIGVEPPTEEMVGRSLRELNLPDGCLVAMIRRGGRTIVPRGSTVLEAKDRITVIGEVDVVERLRKEYAPEG